MPQVRYPWKRFWYPLGADFRLFDGGYLSDPDGEHGQPLNPDAVSFDHISNIPCLVLLGEPGIGKSTALQNSDATLRFDLGAYQTDTSISQDVFHHPDVLAWLQGANTLVLSFDSLDEGRLTVPNIAKVLIRELTKWHANVSRLHLRVACRMAEWPVTLEDALKELWGEHQVGVFQLAPLRHKDVIDAAHVNGIDPATFLDEVAKREAVPLACKPVTLGFLLACFQRDGRFPTTKAELYLEGCRSLCEDSDARRDTGLSRNLSADERMGVAARIAALTIFGGFSAVWKGSDRGTVPDGDLALRRIVGGAETACDMPVPVDEDAVREALDTGLFSGRGTHRLGWAHHTYAEFLAARYVANPTFTTTQAMSLIALPGDKEGKLAPQLHETAAWLASIRPEIFQRIMESDPSVLLLSDVATAEPHYREKLVGTLLKLYDDEKLLDSNWGLRSLYRKLRHPTLTDQLRPYIVNSTKGPVVRRVAIDIAEACAIQELQTDLVDVALDVQQDVPTRVQAAYALTRIADGITKARLKPLAIAAGNEDAQDELKGCALTAIWPALMSADELFASLTPPKQESFGGAYSNFLASILPKSMERAHLPAALKWLEGQSIRRDLPFTFENLADTIMRQASDGLHAPEVFGPFTDIILSRLRNGETAFGNRLSSAAELLANSDANRYLLIERLVPQLADNEVSRLVWPPTRLVDRKDFCWLLGKLKTNQEQTLQARWVSLLTQVFDVQDHTHVESLLGEASGNPLLAAAFSYYLYPIDLNSEEAKRQKSYYEESAKYRQGHQTQAVLTTHPAERIAYLLQQFESGNMDAWWHLNREMTLKPDSRYYSDDDFQGDLTVLPGWQNSDTATRLRLLEAARRFIQNTTPNPDLWLGKDIRHYPSVAGYRAFLLLLRQQREALADLTDAVWEKWVCTFLAATSAQVSTEADLNHRLVGAAYAAASGEVIRVLQILIDHENGRFEHLMVLDRVTYCWDEKLAQALNAKVQDDKLKPEFVRTLLAALLERDYAPAYSFALSLVPTPIPEDGQPRSLAVASAAALLGHASDGGWSVVWPAFQTHRDFGKEVVEKLVRQEGIDGSLVLRHLTTSQLADLYLWLTKTYPAPQLTLEAHVDGHR